MRAANGEKTGRYGAARGASTSKRPRNTLRRTSVCLSVQTCATTCQQWRCAMSGAMRTSAYANAPVARTRKNVTVCNGTAFAVISVARRVQYTTSARPPMVCQRRRYIYAMFNHSNTRRGAVYAATRSSVCRRTMNLKTVLPLV